MNLNLKRKLKNILGSQPINIEQFCITCDEDTNMVANFKTNIANCKVCQSNYEIDDKSLDPVVKEMKKFGIF